MEDNSIEAFMESLISEEMVESVDVMEDNLKEESVSLAFKETKESLKIVENNLKEVSELIASEKTKECLNAMKDNLKEKPASSPSKETKETLLKMNVGSDSFDSYKNPEEGLSLQETDKLLKESYNNLLNMSFSPTENCKAISPEEAEKFCRESYNNLLNLYNEDAKASSGKKRKMKNFSIEKEGLASQPKKSSNSKSAKYDDQLIDVPVTYECDTLKVTK